MTAVAGIIGTGLIGSSVGMRARNRGMLVVGTDVVAAAATAARDVGALDQIVSRDELYDRADVIVLAMPVRECIEEIDRLRTARPKASMILDVASVKVPIVEAAAGLDAFVATHPMAGSEQSGAFAARSDLFCNRTWAYVPPESSRRDGDIVRFIETMGARPLKIGAPEHDSIVAFTSHMPQVFATLFSARLAALDDASALCGPAANELRRLGQSQYHVWQDIIKYNEHNIRAELLHMARALHSAAAHLAAHDPAAIEEAFARAARAVE